MLGRKGFLGISALTSWTLVALWAGFVAAPPVSAAPSVQFYVNGALQATYTCANIAEFDCSNPSEVGFNASLTNPEWNVSISAAFYPDTNVAANRQIIYSTAVNDLLNADSFGFIFLQDIAPVAGSLYHENSSSTTDSAFDGVAVTPVAPPAGIPTDGDANAEIAVFTVSTNGGTTYLTSGLDLRQAFVGAPGPGSDTQPGINQSGAGPGGVLNVTRVDVNFSLAGGDDSYTAGGKVLVVPEPAAAALVALGLACLGYAGRRRR